MLIIYVLFAEETTKKASRNIMVDLIEWVINELSLLANKRSYSACGDINYTIRIDSIMPTIKR